MSKKDDLCGVPAAIGMVVLALLFGGVVLAIYPGWKITFDFIFKDKFYFIEYLFSLIMAVASGFYSGAIVSRINRFGSLRSEVLSALNDIDFLSASEREIILFEKSVNKINQIGSDFFRFGHLEAGMEVLNICRNLKCKFSYFCNEGDGEAIALEEAIAEARVNMRAVNYSKKVFLPLGDI